MHGWTETQCSSVVSLLMSVDIDNIVFFSYRSPALTSQTTHVVRAKLRATDSGHETRMAVGLTDCLVGHIDPLAMLQLCFAEKHMYVSIRDRVGPVHCVPTARR